MQSRTAGDSMKLPRRFYNRDPVTVAQELLGMHLVHVSRGVKRVGRIVEVESYLGPRDLASHSSKGRTARTEVMFGAPGHAYVYMIYGLHYCMNVVTGPEGAATAVLLRALEPVLNLPGRTCGPGLLCKAMRISLRQNGSDLLAESLYVEAPSQVVRGSIVRRRRIGVDYAGSWANRLLRFYLKDSSCISRP
jgi:DNA-3-methyladenine glycosylase